MPLSQKESITFYNAMRAHRQPWVYYIQAGTLPIVKIGLALNPARRLAQIQVSNHESLSIVGIEKGNKDLETERHTQFESLRIRGEWYRYEGALLEHVDELCREQDEEADRCAFSLRRLPDSRVSLVEKTSGVLMAIEADLESARQLAQRWVEKGLAFARAEAVKRSDAHHRELREQNAGTGGVQDRTLYSSHRKARQLRQRDLTKTDDSA